MELTLKMSESDLSSIPLPSMAELGKTSRKTAKEMLQEALRDAQKDPADSLKVASSCRKTNSSRQSKMKVNNIGSGKSSQSIVDELFKDFIAQKFNRAPSDNEVPEVDGKTGPSTGGSVDEISKILDREINSIQKNSSAKEVDVRKSSHNGNVEDKTRISKHRHKVKSGKRSRSEAALTEASPDGEIKRHNPSSVLSVTGAKEPDSNLAPVVPELPEVAESLPVSNTSETNLSSSSTTQPDANGVADSSQNETSKEVADDSKDKTNNTSNLMLPTPLAKKQAIPKQLGLKLTSVSLSLIKSTDRVDKDGRVWEEGEVNSSHSEDDQGDSESELDGCPSETGSINSDAPEWRDQVHKSKKKHKHKHKKRKKKSSSKDKDKRDRDKSDEKSSSRDKKRSKHSEKSSPSHEHRERSRSKSKESSKKDSREGASQKHDAKKNKTEDEKHNLRTRSKSPKHHKSSRKSHSRSRSPIRGHYDEWDARHYSSKHRSRSRSHDRSSERSKRRSSNTSHHKERKRKETREQRLQIDKVKLRRIAIANALVNMKAGQGPQVDVPVVKSEGKSVQELTEFCKKIADKGKDGEGSEVSDSSDEDVPQASDEEETLIHHPFKIKEPVTSGIVMNIRNSKQLPVLTPLEKQAQKANLRLAFPVSSGSHHRANESEWVPVERPSPAAAPTTGRATSSGSATTQKAKSWPVLEPPPQVAVPEEPKKSNSIFPDPSEAQSIDIGSIISERLQAVRKLQQNPYDVQALSSMHKAQEQASKWATSKHLPGQFTGSTGAKVLSQAELIGDKKHQAWAKKTQLSQAAPVTGGIGMFLLQKMGWKHGEGLGKNNEGSKEPLMLDVKVDRKGLTAAIENPQKKAQTVPIARAKDLSNKHPVSALMELCNRRKWGPPVFTVVDESGPDHKKNFLFKVKVNNIEYQPTVPSSNKKTAKAQCAGVCLQELGLIPRDAPLNI